MNPLGYGVIDTMLLMVLCFREAHTLIFRITELVREDDHEVLAREMLLQFIWQPLQGVLVRDGSLTGRHHQVYSALTFG